MAKAQEVLLIDLERSIQSGRLHYWKDNKMGYTTDVYDAGRYDGVVAVKEVMEDVDRRTISIPMSNVVRILGK